MVSGKDEQGNVVDVPRIPVSFSYVLERRLSAPEDVRKVWQRNYFVTGDGSVAGTRGDHLIVLDAQLLSELSAEKELFEGALVLSDGVLDELKGQKENVLHLTADEVKKAQCQGYVKKNGVWTPANTTVAKIWKALSRGKNLTSYVQLVSENCPDRNRLLNIYLNQTTKNNQPTMRSWVAGGFDDYSDAGGSYDLDDDGGRLVGVAPEAHVAREKALEARVNT